MHTTHTQPGFHRPIADQPADAWLNWFLAANAAESARLSRREIEDEIAKMRRPISIEKAYARFGMLLGALPPAAIFYRLFGDLTRSNPGLGWFLLLLAMNVVCCLAGRFFASKLSQMAETAERRHWLIMLFTALLIGLLWGTMTGAAGGFIFFGVGAILGTMFAVPVGLLAFALFVPLHRLLAHGGMIEASHLWPLACGVTMTITALILGL